jgi:hypothetical protein
MARIADRPDAFASLLEHISAPRCMEKPASTASRFRREITAGCC